MKTGRVKEYGTRVAAAGEGGGGGIAVLMPGLDAKAGRSGKMHVRDWAPDIDRWPRSWMGIKEDLEYGKKLLPFLEEFLQGLIEEGMSRKTFVQYRDNVWLLGGTIISKGK